MPVVRLDAAKLAAIEPKGKHHRTLPAKYVVKSGDTLASIAQHLYASSNYWPVLYWANHGQIKYANEITAGQVLTVPAKPAKIPAAPKALGACPTPAPASHQHGQHGELRGELLVGKHGRARADAGGEQLQRQHRLVPGVRHRGRVRR